MRDDSKIALSFLRRFPTVAQRRPQPPLVAGDHAFHLPPLAIGPAVEVCFHLPAVWGFRPAAAGVPPVQGDQGRTDPQVLTSQAMIVLPVVGGIPQQAVDRQVMGCLPNRGGKLAGISAGPLTEDRPHDEVRPGMADQGEFRPMAPDKRPVLGSAKEVVPRRVTALQAGRVNGRLGFTLDQAACPGSTDNRGQEIVEGPFFRSRCSA